MKILIHFWRSLSASQFFFNYLRKYENIFTLNPNETRSALDVYYMNVNTCSKSSIQPEFEQIPNNGPQVISMST